MTEHKIKEPLGRFHLNTFYTLKKSKIQPHSLVSTYVRKIVIWEEEEVGLRDGGVLDQRSAGIFIYEQIFKSAIYDLAKCKWLCDIMTGAARHQRDIMGLCRLRV